jgi:dipeptide/tripeptide permease
MEDPGAVKLPYPKSIPFILTTEFCERFSYYGMRGHNVQMYFYLYVKLYL